MFTSLAGRSVVVTGGSKGIGKGMASAFVACGAQVLITGRDEARLRTTADELACSYVVADVTLPESCAHVAAVAAARNGGIDVLCANAGIYPSARVRAMAPDDLEMTMRTNFNGTVYSVQACLPWLEVSGRGRIIVTSSTLGPLTGFPEYGHYGASKAAQVAFVRTAALELARTGTTINALLPGNIAVEEDVALPSGYVEGMIATIPVGRMGTVADVASAALFFATDESQFITGQTLVIDGGQVLPFSALALEAI